ncbi:anthrone oxygenase family protein [Streptomyces sp. NPDC005963]|uniref:anthrone oxygenase family protein n=1 Tax=Streptomyces sp. NPDC005963 TaxID=3156721 RepID=UPI0033EBF951
MRTDSFSHPSEHVSGTRPGPLGGQDSLAKRGGRDLPAHLSAGVLLMISTVALGLTAGLLFTFGVAVMPGLAETDDPTYVTAMQSFNDTIQSNWALAVLFAGVLPATVVAAVLDHRNGRRAAARWAAYAAILYLGALLVTAGFNIPMNSDLAALGDPSTMTDFAIVDRFKTTWVAANALRAVLCAAALGCLTRALVLHGRSTAPAPVR